MKPFANLDAFLQTLRSEGIPVGAWEITRLHHLFQQQPDLDQQQLKDTLACLLAKTTAERRTLDRVFELWWAQADSHTKPEASVAVSSHESRPYKTAINRPFEPNAGSKPRFTRSANAWVSIITVLAVFIFAQWLVFFPFQGSPPPSVDTTLPSVDTTLPSVDTTLPSVDTTLPNVDTTLPTIEPAITPADQIEQLPVDPVQKYWTWVPTVGTFQSNTALFWPMLGLSLASLGLAGCMWRRFKHNIQLPQGLASPAPGPQWLPMLAPESTGPELINSNQVRNAVWSVGRFVSEQTTDKLNLQQTVKATAQCGGLPQLHHQRAVYDREVWLWVDEQSQHPAVPRLAAELQISLLRAGLPTRLAWFSGLPDRLTWEQGTVFDPLVWDGHRNSVIVAILSEGEDFIHAWQSAHRLHAFKHMLYAFAQWPRLAFVDFSGGQDALNTMLEQYNISHIAPHDLASFLGGLATQYQPLAANYSDDLRLWAAAACLQNDALDQDTAYALHHHLGLSIPNSEIQAFWQQGQDQAERVSWSRRQRMDNLRWLSTAEQLNPDQTLTDHSLLGAAVSFWRQHLADQAEQRALRQTDFKPWRDTPAQRELAMKQGLIDLWDRPVNAVNQLFELFKSEQGATLKQQIRQRLNRYYPFDSSGLNSSDDKAVIRLPWRFQSLPAKTRLMLAEMGLAGDSIKPKSQLQPTAKLGMALGLLAGVALSSFIAALSAPGALEAPYFLASKAVFDDPLFRRYTLRHWQPLAVGGYRYTVGSPKRLQTATGLWGQSAALDWLWTELKNIEVLDGAELWHAGTLPQPIRACADQWPRRSLVVIGIDAQQAQARQLAIRLLDKGSADVVLLGQDWAKHLPELTGGNEGGDETDQLLMILPKAAVQPADFEFVGKLAVIHSDQLEALARSINFQGSRSIAEHWGGDSSEVLLWGGPEIEDYQGMKLVKVCGGTFSMGATEADRKTGFKYDNESPQHTVTLDLFEINQTEVTEGQFSSIQNAKESKTARLPKNTINWHDAQAFCQKYKLDLPTEAQWEYAARAGTLTPWSLGNEAEELDEYAWSDKDYNEGPSPVASKKPNPLNLFDMHGNVWEWIQDCYDQTLYQGREDKGTTLEPLNNSLSCRDHSLRGGSYYVSAEDLRSARRYRRSYWPKGEFWRIGFRCVRAPRRQP